MVHIDFTDDMMDVAYMTAADIEKYLAEKLKETLGGNYKIQAFHSKLGEQMRELQITVNPLNPTRKDSLFLNEYKDNHDIRFDEEFLAHFLSKQFGEHWTFRFFVEDNKGCYIVRIEE